MIRNSDSGFRGTRLSSVADAAGRCFAPIALVRMGIVALFVIAMTLFIKYKSIK